MAGVVEAARVLSKYQFECTLTFIAFDCEEEEEIGSLAYVSHHAGDDIRGMIQLEEIAYNFDPLHYNNAAVLHATTNTDKSIAVSHDMVAALTTYGRGVVAWPYELSADHSDHVSFDAAGFGAACLIGYTPDMPYRHTPQDSVDTPNYVDYEYAANMTRGVVGYLATQAVLVPEPATFLMFVVGAIGLAAYAIRVRFR